MDWTAAIDKHRDALKRVVAMLVAMAGFVEPGAAPASLPRCVHRAVLRLLRPAEAAARRLIVVAAHGLVLVPQHRRPSPRRPAAKSGAAQHSLALFDSLRGQPRRRRPVPTVVPRIRVIGWSDPAPLPVRPKPLPDDPLDAARLRCRLTALAAALDDLPRQARRLARWRYRRDAALQRGRAHRLSPLRPGPPPGLPKPGTGRAHAVHATLDDLHGLAFWVLQHPDTS